ncbi:regulatory protein, LuxR [Methylophaga frappieri]|uniref:Regulatory protein, LuxR n=1 Tax=Methylophaga frappieri (strain ATCC BAA-2434 / DSM 25690 / JAM7) TaxID=754477 RepID=I1YG30_METFJ|nr:response regulator transcription factor [Methylophaga frappieri]AFJ01873.1 regulatory protein, LuxR [Methylophaga frappieri]
MGIEMNQHVTEQTRVYLAFAEAEKAKQAMTALHENYLCFAYRDIDALCQALVMQTADMLICDQQLLEQNQAEVMAKVREAAPNSRILIVGKGLPIGVQIAALKQGARGYFNESLPFEKLRDAIHLILQGEVWVERHLISDLINEINQAPQVDDVHREAAETLSPKEREVATLVSHGATNKMIAKQMDITERTVKAHLTTIFQKMNLPDRLSLAIVFRDLR